MFMSSNFILRMKRKLPKLGKFLRRNTACAAPNSTALGHFSFKKIFQLLFASYVLINGIFTSFWAFCNLNNQNRTIITILTIFSDFKTTQTYILWWLFWFKILLINCLKTNSLWPHCKEHKNTFSIGIAGGHFVLSKKVCHYQENAGARLVILRVKLI